MVTIWKHVCQSPEGHHGAPSPLLLILGLHTVATATGQEEEERSDRKGGSQTIPICRKCDSLHIRPTNAHQKTQDGFGCRINTQKSVAAFLTLVHQWRLVEKVISKTTPVMIAAKKKKKEPNASKQKSGKPPQRKYQNTQHSKGDTRQGRPPMFTDWQNQHSQKAHELQIQGNPRRNANIILHRPEKSALKFIWKYKDPESPKYSLGGKKSKAGGSKYLISNYSTKPRQQKQHGTRTVTDMWTTGTEQRTQK